MTRKFLNNMKPDDHYILVTPESGAPDNVRSVLDSNISNGRFLVIGNIDG